MSRVDWKATVIVTAILGVGALVLLDDAFAKKAMDEKCAGVLARATTTRDTLDAGVACARIHTAHDYEWR